MERKGPIGKPLRTVESDPQRTSSTLSDDQVLTPQRRGARFLSFPLNFGDRAATNRVQGWASRPVTEQSCVPGVTIFAFSCLAVSLSAFWSSRRPQQRPLLRAP